MEYIKLFVVFELGALCGAVIMCMLQGGRYIMATTSMWAVKYSLKDVLDYASNPIVLV